MPGLTAADQDLIDRARELLAEQAGPDLLSMGIRVGKLEWHVERLLRLVERLSS